MATKKKTKNKQTQSKKNAGKKRTPVRNLAEKRRTLKKKQAKRIVQKKSVVRTNATKKIGEGGRTTPRKEVRATSQSVLTVAFPAEGPETRSGRQSGDLQGLSSVEGADSESVDELLEEGNAFEADVVAGVEDAGNAEEKEVRTHAVSEDDILGEYLDKE
jgi:hypothetical protein